MARTQGSRGDITGPLIRDQALRLFARHGYAAVSMRQIAAAVGVQAGAIYAYVPDKQTLLFRLLSDHMQDLLAAWADDWTLSAPARLDGFVDFHISTSLAHPDAVFLSYMELRSLTPDNLARIVGLRRRYEDGLQMILQDGNDEGTMRVAEPRLTAMALIAMLTGVTQWYREGGRLDGAHLTALYRGLARGAAGVRE